MNFPVRFPFRLCFATCTWTYKLHTPDTWNRRSTKNSQSTSKTKVAVWELRVLHTRSLHWKGELFSEVTVTDLCLFRIVHRVVSEELYTQYNTIVEEKYSSKLRQLICYQMFLITCKTWKGACILRKRLYKTERTRILNTTYTYIHLIFPYKWHVYIVLS